MTSRCGYSGTATLCFAERSKRRAKSIPALLLAIPAAKPQVRLLGAQHMLGNLVGWGLRQVLSEFDVARHFEAGEIRGTMSDNPLRRQGIRRNMRLQHDVDLHFLAAYGVRNRQCGGFGDLADAANDGFNFERRDVLPGAADHVLDATHDREKTARVTTKQVARAEPFAVEGRGGRFRLAVVPLEDSRATHDQLADLPIRQRISLRVRDPAFAEGRGQAA